jgi:hypothetical protein
MAAMMDQVTRQATRQLRAWRDDAADGGPAGYTVAAGKVYADAAGSA